MLSIHAIPGPIAANCVTIFVVENIPTIAVSIRLNIGCNNQIPSVGRPNFNNSIVDGIDGSDGRDESIDGVNDDDKINFDFFLLLHFTNDNDDNDNDDDDVVVVDDDDDDDDIDDVDVDSTGVNNDDSELVFCLIIF